MSTPAHDDLTPLGTAQPGHDFGQLPLTVAGHPRHPDYLGGPDLDLHVADRLETAVSLGGDALDRQDRLAGRRPGTLRDGQIAPDHHPGQGGRIRFGGWHAAHLPAVPEHGHPVGHCHHLVELVGDEDDRPPVIGEGAQRAEEVMGLLRGQHGGRLVQDEDANPAVQELEDLHPLLLADGELPHGRLGRHFQTVPAAQFPHLALQRPPGGEKARLGVAQGQVLGHREPVHQTEVLVDHAHAVVQSLVGGTEIHRFPVQVDLAAVRVVEAGEDRAQGRLAGPVLPQQGVYLAPPQVEVDVLVGGHPEEVLGNAR